jgi:hypothetical protein
MITGSELESKERKKNKKNNKKIIKNLKIKNRK